MVCFSQKQETSSFWFNIFKEGILKTFNEIRILIKLRLCDDDNEVSSSTQDNGDDCLVLFKLTK